MHDGLSDDPSASAERSQFARGFGRRPIRHRWAGQPDVLTAEGQAAATPKAEPHFRNRLRRVNCAPARHPGGTRGAPTGLATATGPTVSGRRRFGAVRKLSSGRWQARYRDAGGALRSAPVTFPTKTDAARWLTVAEADMTRGLWHDPKRGEMPFRKVVKLWLGSKVNLRASTMDGYQGLLDLHILPAFGDRPVGSITALDVQTWLADRKANSRLAPNTLAKAYKLLRAIMESAVDADLIARSPCRVKGAATERIPEMRAATPEEVAAIAEAAGGRWRALILLAAYSGLRWGELGGLRRKHIDLLHRKVRVTGQLTEIRGHLAFSTPKTNAGVRTVTLPAMIVEVLEEHLGRYGQPGVNGLVFVNADGSPLRRENFRRRVWLPACRAAGVEALRFHDLRHTGATLAAASGAPLRAIMHRLGHASAAAAIRYQHIVDGQDETIAEYLDGIARRAPRGNSRTTATELNRGR